MARYYVSIEFDPVEVEVEADSSAEAEQLAVERAFDVATIAEIIVVED